jgi:hypothetical protein
MGVLRPGGGVLAVVRLVEFQGARAVLKDFSGSSRWFRHSVGAYLTLREARAYRALEGVEGIPRLLRRIRPDGLLLEFIEGANCREASGDTFTPGFFQELGALLEAVRGRGVLHLDVKRNVLRSGAGRPFLIDFATSVVLPRWLGPLRRWVLRLAAAYDQQDVAKLKRLVAPHLLTVQDEAVLARPLPLAGVVRFIQDLIQRSVRGLTGRRGRPPQPPPPRPTGDGVARSA